MTESQTHETPANKKAPGLRSWGFSFYGLLYFIFYLLQGNRRQIQAWRTTPTAETLRFLQLTGFFHSSSDLLLLIFVIFWLILSPYTKKQGRLTEPPSCHRPHLFASGGHIIAERT